jgi:hypothetical protein
MAFLPLQPTAFLIWYNNPAIFPVIKYLDQIFFFNQIKTLSDEIKDNLEGEITYAEITASIKRMKNEKSPGSDGFTSEFFKKRFTMK